MKQNKHSMPAEKTGKGRGNKHICKEGKDTWSRIMRKKVLSVQRTHV